MRLNIRLMGLLFGILLIAVLGQILLRSGSLSSRRGAGGDRRGGAGQIALIGLALVLVGYIGVFFGRLIQAAVSRQREYLADAAAVQFTRNPAGIGGALLKILESTAEGGAGATVRNPHAVEAGHLFFASDLRRLVVRGFSTHPPLMERIRRVDPELL
jgi:Zn-dependent protease with chaperone function